MVSSFSLTSPITWGIIVVGLLLLIWVTIAAKKRPQKEKRPIYEIVVLFALGIVMLNVVISPLLGTAGIQLKTVGTKATFVLIGLLIGFFVIIKTVFQVDKFDAKQIIIIIFALALDIIAIIMIDQIVPQSILEIRPILENMLSVIGTTAMSILGVG